MQPCYCLVSGINSAHWLLQFSAQVSLTSHHLIDISVFQQNSPLLIWIVLSGWSANPRSLTPDNAN